MKKILIVLMFLTSSFAGPGHNHAQSDIFYKSWTMMAGIKVSNIHKSLVKFSNMGIEIAGVSYPDMIVDLLVTDVQYKMLVDKGYDLDVTVTKGVWGGPDEEFKNPEEIEQILKKANSDYPNITKLISIGKSLEGREIWALKISSNPQDNDLTKPSVLFNSMHHAREVMSPEVSLDIIEYMTKNYATDSKVANWVDNISIWVIPMLNVDGNNKMWNVDKMWRKNTRNGYGVDLNRNYPAAWGACNGSSGSTSSQTYRGPSPASEPETQALMNFVRTVRPVFDISYHAFSELVLYPSGCKGRTPPTLEVLGKIGNHLGDLLNYKAGQTWDTIYEADGGDIDWMYEAYQVIPYVIELNTRWQGGFHPNYSRHRDKTVEKNRVAWQYLLERSLVGGVRGSVAKDGALLSDFQVKVYKKNLIGRKEFQTYVGHETGMFHLVLNPGKYELDIIQNSKVIGSVKTNVKDALKVIKLEL